MLDYRGERVLFPMRTSLLPNLIFSVCDCFASLAMTKRGMFGLDGVGDGCDGNGNLGAGGAKYSGAFTGSGTGGQNVVNQ